MVSGKGLEAGSQPQAIMMEAVDSRGGADVWKRSPALLSQERGARGPGCYVREWAKAANAGSRSRCIAIG